MLIRQVPHESNGGKFIYLHIRQEQCGMHTFRKCFSLTLHIKLKITMKKILLLLPLLAICFASCNKEPVGNGEGTELSGDDVIPFKDPNFLEALLSENVDSDGDGQITVDEAKAVEYLSMPECDIKEMLEIQYFTALETLDCGVNQLTALDVSSNTALAYLYCYSNQLTSLDVSSNTALAELYCNSNQLTALDVSNNMALTYLACHNNQLTDLDVSSNTALTYLYCYDNQLTALDVSNNKALTVLDCNGNQLTALDVSSNTALEYLYCNNNQLTALDVSSNKALETLDCSGNPLQAITISESQRNASWMNDVKQDYPDIEIIVK